MVEHYRKGAVMESIKDLFRVYDKPYGNGPNSRLWREIRQIVIDAYGGECVICKTLGLPTRPRLSVHHINGDKRDCRWKNLIPMCDSHHGASHFVHPYGCPTYRLGPRQSEVAEALDVVEFNKWLKESWVKYQKQKLVIPPPWEEGERDERG